VAALGHLGWVEITGVAAVATPVVVDIITSLCRSAHALLTALKTV